ncbi:MAG: substrate-binding domain-containing protein [Sphingobacteriales bacterium]
MRADVRFGNAPNILQPTLPEVQKITVYSAGIHTRAKQPEAAKALVQALTASDAAAVIKHHGMEPS